MSDQVATDKRLDKAIKDTLAVLFERKKQAMQAYHFNTDKDESLALLDRWQKAIAECEGAMLMADAVRDAYQFAPTR